MFSFLAGVTLSQYIRRRRLTIASFELNNNDIKIIDVAIKYGYVSASKWAVFESVQSFPETLQNVWGSIYCEWLPFLSYVQAEGPIDRY